MKIPKQANTQNIFFSYKGLRKYFCPPHRDNIFYSTYFRINYLSQPIAGFIN